MAGRYIDTKDYLGFCALLVVSWASPNYEALIDNVAVGVSLFFIVPNIAITAAYA